MSASLRFLGFAVLAWAGVRAASLAFFPGSTALAAPAPAAGSATAPAPPVATHFDAPPPPDPMAYYPGPPSYFPGTPSYYPGSTPPYPSYPAFAPYPPLRQTIVLPAGYAAPDRRRSPPVDGWAGIEPLPAPIFISQLERDPWPGRTSSPPAAARGGAVTSLPATPPRPQRFDRLQLTAWALLRGRNMSPPTSLASGGTLGGSQAGARLTYRFTPAWAATLRSSSSAGGVRGAEVAAGIRWQPFPSIPVAFTAERREGLGRFGGRSAFALFAEGGIYRRPLFGSFYLDGYLQGGVVGMRNRDLFVDGGATLSRPLWRNFSAGVGLWGAAQPGLYRIDAGPRVSMDMGRGIKVHLDYRQRLIGNVAPPSGPAVTLAADF